MAQFFQFEADFVDSLRCIPMQVRLKLDTCGIKLKLPQWHRLKPQERQTLVDQPCSSDQEVQAYRELLQCLVLKRVGIAATDLPVEPNPAWLNTATVPSSLHLKAEEFGVQITLDQWQALSPEQRFALIKLSRSGHENQNFLPALKEFHLV